MTDDDTENLVFDEESGVFIPRQTPATGPAESIPIIPRERAKVIKNDADILHRNGWGVGDTLEGADAVGSEKIVVTAIGQEKVLAKMVAMKMKNREWVPADEHQGRERMFTLTNKVWKKSEPV